LPGRVSVARAAREGLIRLDASADRPRLSVASDARDLGRFTSSEAEREYIAAYDEALALWPIPFTNLTVSTPFADTHVIASGAEAGPPLVLLHATGMSSTIQAALRSDQLRTSASLEETYGVVTSSLVGLIAGLNTQIAGLERDLQHGCLEHRTPYREVLAWSTTQADAA
jgi:hypothetical protein